MTMAFPVKTKQRGLVFHTSVSARSGKGKGKEGMMKAGLVTPVA